MQKIKKIGRGVFYFTLTLKFNEILKQTEFRDLSCIVRKLYVKTKTSYTENEQLINGFVFPMQIEQFLNIINRKLQVSNHFVLYSQCLQPHCNFQGKVLWLCLHDAISN